ncbi:MAG: type II toxin-antitoxin system VapC family toxin [Hyphomonadaceae bacterium]|nr:type II toxin-antitoxin system VapC family toxin [Hyphomonadaceae bacterium]
MTAFVIDASAMLAWCFDDEQPKDPLGLLQELKQGGMAAPVHWPLELTNIVWNAEKHGRISAADAKSFIQLVESLGVGIDFETPRRAWSDVLSLARTEKLTTYDAAYLELAVRLNATLVSKDATLLRAAKRMSVRTRSV